MDELNRDEFVESDFEPLKIYFDQRDWTELSIYEKQRFARIKRNYENLVEMDNEPRPRFPKRNVPKVCYREEDVSSDDDYIYCDDCGEQYEGSCPKHGPLNFVKDKKAPPGPRHAWNTCPDYLSVCRSGIRGAGLGIWTEQDLSKGYVFGPYKGKTVKSRKEAKDSGYSWEIRKSGKVLHYVEGVDTSVSNWMRFVNCAVCEERQNLIAFQYHGQILYRVYKEVKAYTELLVWYGDEFGEELGIFRNEETLLLKGGMKKLEYDRGLAPSSSIRKSYCSGTFQDESKWMAIKSNFRKTVSSSGVPGEVNKTQISQTLENRKRGIKGISTENDISENSISKRDRMDYVAEENLVLSDQNKHVSVAETNGDRRKCHACPQCDYKTSKKGHLQSHINAMHEGKRPYKCPVCDYSASDSSNLRRHVHSVHEGIRRYKCKQCDYRASQASTLQIHIDSVHESKKPYKCQHCDYRASQATHLRTHVVAVHEGKKPYKCKHCDYRASQAATLRKHVAAAHEGKKPHRCPQCDYKAGNSGDIRKHVRAVHEKMKSYGCRICNYRASRNDNLRRHMKALHGGKENTKISKVYN